MSHNSNIPEVIPKLGGTHSFAMYWRFNPEFYRLVGSRCAGCGKKHWPRRHVCPDCGSREMEDVQLSHTGTIEAIGLQTGLYQTGYDDVSPLVHAIIRLDDGPHVEAEVAGVDPEYLRDLILNPPGDMRFYDQLEGRRARMVIRRLRKQDNGNVSYGYKFILLDQ